MLGEAILLPGFYSVFAELNFRGKAMTLRSEAGREATVLGGGAGNRAFIFNSDETPETRVVGLTITGFSGTVGRGAGILMENASPTIVDCVISHCRTIPEYVGPFQNNIGSEGAGVWIDGGSPTFRECSVVDNVADAVGGAISSSINGFGGGMLCQRANLVVEDCDISRTIARSSGAGQGSAYGGIVLAGCRTLLSRCTISENSATQYGGLFVNGGQTCVVNCTVSGNIRGWFEAYGTAEDSVYVDHCTIVFNTGRGPNVAAGLIIAEPMGGGVRNSIIALNDPNSLGQAGRRTLSLGHNVVSSPAGNFRPHPTDQLDTTPDFLGDPMRLDNGFALLPAPGSPQIDAAWHSPGLVSDQQGFPRICDGNGDGHPSPDIGSAELQGAACEVEPQLPLLGNYVPFDVNLDGVTDAADMIAYPDICPRDSH